MMYGLLTSILAVTHMIPLLLVIAAILWIALLLFEKIVPYLPLREKLAPPPDPAPTVPALVKSTSVLGATKTRLTPPPRTAAAMKVPQQADDISAKSQSVEQVENGVEPDEAPEPQLPGADDDPSLCDDDDNEENNNNDENVDEEPDVDAPIQPVIPATMASQLPPPPLIVYKPLQMEPDAVQYYPLSTIEHAASDPPAFPVEQYARRLKTIRTAAFDIARVVRNKQRNQSAEQLATQLVGLIEQYQLLADMNVKQVIDQAHERSRQTYDEHIELFFRIQNACISGELDDKQNEITDWDEPSQA